MESALSRLVVLRQPGLTFAGPPCLYNVSPCPRPGSRAGWHTTRTPGASVKPAKHPKPERIRQGWPVWAIAWKFLFGRLEPAFFFYDGVTSDDDSQ